MEARKTEWKPASSYVVERKVICIQTLLVKSATSKADAIRQIGERAFIADGEFEHVECMHTEVVTYCKPTKAYREDLEPTHD